MKRAPRLLGLSSLVMLGALGCDPPKKPPMMPDNDLGDAGVDIPELATPPTPPAPPKK